MFFFLCHRGFLQQVFQCVRLFPDELRCERILWIQSKFCGLSQLAGVNDRFSKPSIISASERFYFGSFDLSFVTVMVLQISMSCLVRPTFGLVLWI